MLMLKISKKLSNTDTSDRPSEYAKLYVTNALVNKENEECMRKFQADGKTIFTVHAKNSKADVHTSSCEINTDENISISSTVNLPGTLKNFVGARVMLTHKKDLGDRFINGLMATVMHIHGVRNNNKATGIIFI